MTLGGLRVATSRSISSISYNSIPFLESRLKTFLDSDKLQFWAYIFHHGESLGLDEGLGKDHIHLLLIPNGRIDLAQLGRMFTEFLPHEPKRPLRCMPFRVSDVSEWIMYVLHDADYLASKNLVRQYRYQLSDIVSSDDVYLGQLYVEALQRFNNDPLVKLRRAAEKSLSFSDLVASGQISLGQIRNAEVMYGYLFNDRVAKVEQGLEMEDGMVVFPRASEEWEQITFST